MLCCEGGNLVQKKKWGQAVDRVVGRRYAENNIPAEEFWFVDTGALKVLRERHLIAAVSTGGKWPNQYQIPQFCKTVISRTNADSWKSLLFNFRRSSCGSWLVAVGRWVMRMTIDCSGKLEWEWVASAEPHARILQCSHLTNKM